VSTTTSGRRLQLTSTGTQLRRLAIELDVHNAQMGSCIVLALREGAPGRPRAPESLGPGDIDNC
jgi:hypothetical protein